MHNYVYITSPIVLLWHTTDCGQLCPFYFSNFFNCTQQIVDSHFSATSLTSCMVHGSLGTAMPMLLPFLLLWHMTVCGYYPLDSYVFATSLTSAMQNSSLWTAIFKVHDTFRLLLWHITVFRQPCQCPLLLLWYKTVFRQSYFFRNTSVCGQLCSVSSSMAHSSLWRAMFLLLSYYFFHDI